MEFDLNYLAGILSTEKGRKFIFLLLTISDVDNRTMLTDSLLMARHEGQRSVGLALLRAIRSIKASSTHQDGYELEAMIRREGQKLLNALEEEEDF